MTESRVLAGQLSQVAGIASLRDSSSIKNGLYGVMGNQITTGAQKWLNQFGTSKIELSVSPDFSLQNTSFDMLLPVYDNGNNMLFTQFGLRNTDSVNTYNIGGGWRYFSNGWMYGGNLFYDYSEKNQRLGAGMEAWTSYFKFSANYYHRLSQWQESKNLKGYYERPANGFDLRTKGFLPALPQLGGKLVYEKYYGKEVALQNREERHRDPQSVRAELNYTPVPLITLGAGHRIMTGGNNDTQLTAQLTLRPDYSWDDHISPGKVDAMRQLTMSRTDLVERNNVIILDYKKEEAIKLTLPASVSGSTRSSQMLTATVTSKAGLKRIDWLAPRFVAEGGSIVENSKDQVTLTLPQTVSAEPYVLSAVATDNRGNVSNRAVTHIYVHAVQASAEFSSVQLSRDTIPADGTTTATITVTLHDDKNEPVIGMESLLNSSASPEAKMKASGHEQSPTLGEYKEKKPGIYEALYTAGKAAGRFNIQTTFGEQVLPELTMTQEETVTSTLVLTDNDVLANGVDVIHAYVQVVGLQGNPVAGVPVNWNIAAPAQPEQTTTKTDDTGKAYNTFSSVQPGRFNVTATTEGMPPVQGEARFIIDPASVSLTAHSLSVVTDNALANGRAYNQVRIIVADKQGSPVEGQVIRLSASNNATIENRVIIDNQGSALVNISSIRAGKTVVTAMLNNVTQTINVNFVPDVSTLTGTITILENNALADGVDQDILHIKAADANGNPVEGEWVQLQADNGASIIPRVKTGIHGLAVVPVTNITAGESHISATIGNSTHTIALNFMPNMGTATILASDMTIIKNGAVANGTATNQIGLRVVDSQRNPISGVTVGLTANNSATITSTVTTDKKGEATATLTSLSAGNSQVRASVNGTHQTVIVNFVADAATAKVGITVKQNNALADGTEQNLIQLLATDNNNNPVAGATVKLSASNGASIVSSIETDDKGIATVSVTSTTVGTSTISASLGGHTDTENVEFIADSGTATILDGDLTITRDNAIANGTATNEVQIRVVDALDHPISGATVYLTAGNSATIASSVTTDSNGKVTAQLTSLKSGSSIVRASINGTHRSVTTTFTGDASTVMGTITVFDNNALADGQDQNLIRVMATDVNGNRINGQSVQLTADNGATVTAPATTAINGTIWVIMKSNVAGISTLSATIGNTTVTAPLTFVANNATATILASDLTITKDGAFANGSDTNQISLRVVDGQNNPVPNINVALSASNGAKISSKVTTDKDGKASATLTSTTAGESTVTAKVNNVSRSIKVTFATVVATTLTLTADKTTAKVGENITLTVLAKDALKNPLPNAVITFDVGSALNRQGKSATSGELNINGNAAAATEVYYTDAAGKLEVSVTDPLGTGVSRKITAISGQQHVDETVVFTVITSPDSPAANMWGHMAETMVVNQAVLHRPYLNAESKGAGTRTENNEVWATHTQATAVALCGNAGLPAKSTLTNAVSLYGVRKITPIFGWPTGVENRTSTLSPQGGGIEYSRVSLATGGASHGSNDSLKLVSCL